MLHKTLSTASLLLLTLSAALAPGAAHAGELDGTWSGSGWVYPRSSPKERVKCRVTYRQQSAKVFSVKATCATPSAKIIDAAQGPE